MRKNSEISFIEGFCPIALPADVSGGEYAVAVEKAGEVVKSKEKYLTHGAFDVVKEDDIAHIGSGWGALENMISKKPISKYCVFPKESLTREQADWVALAEGNPLPQRNESDVIPSFAVGEYWEKTIEKTLVGTWYEYLQLGVIKYEKGDYEAAKKCFEQSIKCRPSAWAYRNLAQIKGNVFGDVPGASRDMEKAADMQSEYIPILIETATALMRAGEYERQIERYEKYSDAVKAHGRLKMLTGACYVSIGDTDTAKKFINEKLVVADIMEGEYSLSEIWYELYARVLAKEKDVDYKLLGKDEVLAKYPLPYELDFRMK